MCQQSLLSLPALTCCLVLLGAPAQTASAAEPRIDVNAEDITVGEVPKGDVQALSAGSPNVFFETVEVDGEKFLKMDDQSDTTPVFLRTKSQRIQSPVVTLRFQGVEMKEAGDGDFKIQLGTGGMRSKENEVALGFSMVDGRFHGSPRYAVGELVDVVVVANNTDEPVAYGDGNTVMPQSADVWIDGDKIIQSVKTYNKAYPVNNNLDIAEVRTHSTGKQGFLIKRFAVYDQAVSPDDMVD